MATILMVDDSVFQHRSIRRILSEDTYTLLTATSGDEALTLLANQSVDCVLLDIMMPGINGMELLEILQENDFAAPVIMVTADIQVTTRQQCLELGAFAVLHKPLQSNELHTTLRAALAYQHGNSR